MKTETKGLKPKTLFNIPSRPAGSRKAGEFPMSKF